MSYVEFAGEEFPIPEDRPLSIGREGDVVIDDNPFLHRRFLEVHRRADLVWIANVGGQLTATVGDENGLVETLLGPGASVPLVLSRSVVWFTAGATTYDFDIVVDDPPFVSTPTTPPRESGSTIGQVTLTYDQRLLLVALAEEFLRRGVRGRANIPPSRAAAERLGWTITKFNRKLDNVCEKLSKMGVRGLTSAGGRNASTRRARLVEYSLSSRLVTPNDLVLLDRIHP